MQRSHKTRLYVGMPLILGYGLLTRRLFGLQGDDGLLGLVTIGFVCIFPFILGFLTVLVLPRKYKKSWLHAIFVPWLSGGLLIAIILALAWEAWICVLMAAPFFFSLISLGGMAMCALARRGAEADDSPRLYIALVLIAPYLIGLLESQLPTPETIRTVESQIIIDAPPEIVWSQITTVPEIQPAEHGPAFFRLAGLPKPIQAMLPTSPLAPAEEVIGMTRQSAYQGPLLFIEQITIWQPNQRYHFTIDVDPTVTPAWPWSQIGGRHFDLLDGAYIIEPLIDQPLTDQPLTGQRVILHLSSRHRLTTKFNTYGGLWTEMLLADIQRYILRVVKERAEKKAGQM